MNIDEEIERTKNILKYYINLSPSIEDNEAKAWYKGYLQALKTLKD